jgi:predicted nucleotidyltransferase
MHRQLSRFVARKLARFRNTLEGRFGGRLRELILYGSYARGEANEDSDVDVLDATAGCVRSPSSATAVQPPR